MKQNLLSTDTLELRAVIFIIIIFYIARANIQDIYDENNFTFERSNNPSYLYMDFRTSGGDQLKVFAKPKRCEDGIPILYMFIKLHKHNVHIKLKSFIR